MRTIRIRHILSGEVIYKFSSDKIDDPDSSYSKLMIGEKIAEAALTRVDFSFADLSGIYFENFDMSRGKFKGANLSGCRIINCDLSDCNFKEANFTRSFLKCVNLSSSKLEYSYFFESILYHTHMYFSSLFGADFSSSVLKHVDFDSSDLSATNFSRAMMYGVAFDNVKFNNSNLEPVRKDIFSILACAPNEAQYVLNALNNGAVDGRVYEGDCACLVGTIAKSMDNDYQNIKGINPDSFSPAEMFFRNIVKGNTPENSAFSRQAAQWVSEFIDGLSGSK